VERLIDLDRLREAVGVAMADLSAGRVSMPTRIAVIVPERDGKLAAMPAYLPASRALAKSDSPASENIFIPPKPASQQAVFFPSKVLASHL